MRLHLLALVCLLANASSPLDADHTIASSTAPQGEPSVAAKLDGIIEEPDLRIVVPAPRCAVPAVAARVLQSVDIPAGIEYAPELCTDRPGRVAPEPEPLTLTGLTAREALRRLVTIDPRYHWIESNDMVVMRPISAWSDSSHFLNRTAPSFHIDAPNYAGALHAVQAALVGWPLNSDAQSFGDRTPQGSTPISVHRDVATSAYDALNAIVRAHGSLRWRVTYCAQQARHEYATMWLETYDDSGLGNHPAVLKDATGKRYDACSSTR